MPQFDTTFFIGQIFWLLVSFGGLYLGIYFIVFPMFRTIFFKRSQLIEGPIEQAEKITQEIQALQEKEKTKKDLFEKRCEEKLAKTYQAGTDSLKEIAQKKDKDLSARFKKVIQKLEQDEKKVLEGNKVFVEKAFKGDL